MGSCLTWNYRGRAQVEDHIHNIKRVRVAACLQQWGDRIQRSVFVCAVAPEDLDDMVGRVEEMIDSRTDAVHLLFTCATCWSRLVVRGQADAIPDKPY